MYTKLHSYYAERGWTTREAYDKPNEDEMHTCLMQDVALDEYAFLSTPVEEDDIGATVETSEPTTNQANTPVPSHSPSNNDGTNWGGDATKNLTSQSQGIVGSRANTGASWDPSAPVPKGAGY